MEFNDDTSNRTDVGLPGPLRCEVVLTLHTRKALTLFQGRQQKGDEAGSKDYTINNLKKFAIKMNAIWFAAQNNDPFADWCLYRIEQKMEEARNLMSAEKAKFDGILASSDSVKFMPTYANEPVVIQLSFATPFPYQAANLIAQYDELACVALTACHTGFIAREIKDASINIPAKRIRKLFMMASEWKPSRVTRDTYDPATADTRKAEAAMGTLPKGFLDKSLRAKIAPHIRRPSDIIYQSNGKLGAQG